GPVDLAEPRAPRGGPALGPGLLDQFVDVAGGESVVAVLLERVPPIGPDPAHVVGDLADARQAHAVPLDGHRHAVPPEPATQLVLDTAVGEVHLLVAPEEEGDLPVRFAAIVALLQNPLQHVEPLRAGAGVALDVPGALHPAVRDLPHRLEGRPQAPVLV